MSDWPNGNALSQMATELRADAVAQLERATVGRYQQELRQRALFGIPVVESRACPVDQMFMADGKLVCRAKELLLVTIMAVNLRHDLAEFVRARADEIERRLFGE